jgi:hypothetical protein
MDVLYPRCCGLDIHKKLIVACRVLPSRGRTVQKEIRSFGTTTAAIEELSAWLREGGITHARKGAFAIRTAPRPHCPFL